MVSGFRCPRRFGIARLLLACCLLIASAIVAVRQAPETAALALGGGSYRVTASVFGIPDDDLVGNETSSGHILAPYDRLVALPACTESSCPWVPLGTGTSGQYGPQTSCAEVDGLCWVELVSQDTGICTVAPVLDRGPLFVEDNWWAVRDSRSYRLKMGLPAAEAARDGMDVGYGPGISDRGYDVQNVYDYAAAIDIAAGTWADLGLDPAQGVGDVEVRLLWQTDIDHTDACGNYGNAQTSDSVNFRAGPSTSDDVLTLLDPGDRLGIIGGQQNGFYPVVHGGLTGWVFADYVLPDGSNQPGATAGIVVERLNLRAGPSTADDVLDRMPAGSLVVLTGEEENGFLSVSFGGTDGWAFADYVDTGEGFGEGGGGGNQQGNATTTDRVNFRAGPSLDDDVLLVVPTGANVLVTGEAENGFLPATYQGTDGWLYAAYVDTFQGSDDGGRETTTTTDRLNLRSGPSTSDSILLTVPDGATVDLTGQQENGFYSADYQGNSGWLYGDYLSVAGNVSQTITENLNLRAGPSTDDEIILVMPAGDRVTATGGEENGFLPVRYHGQEGWAYAQYLE